MCTLMTNEPSACTRGFDICLDGYSKLREKIAARLRGAATDLSLIGRAVSGAFRFLQRRQIWHIILRDTGAKASVLEIGWLHSCLASLLLLLNQNRARGTKPTKTPTTKGFRFYFLVPDLVPELVAKHVAVGASLGSRNWAGFWFPFSEPASQSI